MAETPTKLSSTISEIFLNLQQNANALESYLFRISQSKFRFGIDQQATPGIIGIK